MWNAVRSAVLTTSLAVLVLVSAGVAHAGDSAWKAAHDDDPHLPLTAQQIEATNAKRAAEVIDGGALLASLVPGAVICGSCGGGGSYPASASLAANQTAQITSYYCGPAAVHETLGALGISLSQSSAAAALHTTTAGTAWSGGGTSPSGYPVPDVLDARQSRNFYVPQFISWASSSAVATYETDLEQNIYALGVPLVGDAWETKTSAHHLVGHPTDRTIYHWFEIRGYQSSGGSTMYEDSVHNAGSISWSAGVPAYSTLPSSWIVSIVSGRGYVW